MLKARLIPVIIARGNLVVQSFDFNKYLPIGNVKTAIEFFVQWDVDEIIILDITASKEGRSPNFSLIESVASECFVPLTVGGGIQNIEEITSLINSGADKICLNSYALKNPQFVKNASSVFGSQCITVSIDAFKQKQDYMVFDYINYKPTSYSVLSFAKKVEELGAGEIFLNSVNRDGSRDGYDIQLLKMVSNSVNIPVIACGGVGSANHLPLGITKGNCQAVAAANIFQHTEHSTIAAKSMMIKQGVEVRLNSSATYKNFDFDYMGRPF